MPSLTGLVLIFLSQVLGTVGINAIILPGFPAKNFLKINLLLHIMFYLHVNMNTVLEKHPCFKINGFGNWLISIVQ